jgi:heme O synthase-like polyprenyltransferase
MLHQLISVLELVFAVQDNISGLLLSTGPAGYMSTRCPVLNLSTILGLAGSLFLSISGSTVLNMWYDRDIDAKMQRTCWRPLPAGQINPRNAMIFYPSERVNFGLFKYASLYMLSSMLLMMF